MNDHIKNSSSDSSHEARTRRVQNLRELTGLSRRAFAQKYHLPTSTMQNWEDLKGNGLTEKGARKLVGILKAEGIYCTAEWLLHGVGVAPEFSQRHFKKEISTHAYSQTLTEDAQSNLIGEELRLFHQHNPNTAIDLIVEDDAMLPRFVVGEYVAGVRYYNNAIEKVIGMDCIVQLTNGELLLRTIKKGNLPERYTLICSNPQTTVAKPILYDVELISAAPVVWTRRKLFEIS